MKEQEGFIGKIKMLIKAFLYNGFYGMIGRK